MLLTNIRWICCLINITVSNYFVDVFVVVVVVVVVVVCFCCSCYCFVVVLSPVWFVRNLFCFVVFCLFFASTSVKAYTKYGNYTIAGASDRKRLKM